MEKVRILEQLKILKEEKSVIVVNKNIAGEIILNREKMSVE